MSSVLTGARGVVKMDSLPVAFVSNVSVEHRIGHDAIPQLDSIEIAEYAETSMTVTVSFGVYKPINLAKSATQLFGLNPQNPNHLLTLGEITLELFDGLTDTVAYVAEGCRFAGGSGSLNARGIWEGKWEFKAKRGRGI